MAIALMDPVQDQASEPQDNFVESREPTELTLCVVLAAAYAGLAKYCWEPLKRASEQAGSYSLLVNVEGLFVTIALLSLVVGLRPFVSPSSLQISHRGLKYRGPYWPQRKTVNWDQVARLYISPELIVVLYYRSKSKKGVWPLLVQSVYLADREKIPGAFARYCPVEPIMLGGPGWITRLALIVAFALAVIWILQTLLGRSG